VARRVTALLAIDRLCVRYDSRDVLRSLSLDVARGEIVALMGPSGVGTMNASVTVASAFSINTFGALPSRDTATMSVGALSEQVGRVVTRAIVEVAVVVVAEDRLARFLFVGRLHYLPLRSPASERGVNTDDPKA